jgi:hypothetical protein
MLLFCATQLSCKLSCPCINRKLQNTNCKVHRWFIVNLDFILKTGEHNVDRVQKPVILSVIYHHQNPLESNWTYYFPEDVSSRKIRFLYGQLVATLHPVPGKWPCAPLLCIRTSTRWHQTLLLLV